MSLLELSFFGPPRVRLGGSDLHFDTRKAVAMLAILAVTGREHSRDSLAAMLWPELERTRARATLRRTLSVATAVGPALEVTPSGVRLQPELVRCDVQQVHMLAATPDAGAWARAVDLAGGEFLEGFGLRDSPVFEDWQIATSEALRDLVSQALARLVSDAVARADLAQALGYARRRVQVEPLSEPAHADLIRVTAWNGDRPAAITAYRALVRLLDRELGVPPLPETLALHETIRSGSLAPPFTRLAETTPRALLTEESAILSPPMRIVGRDRELSRLEAAWRDDAVRCVGLVGDPGIGKTALSREFAGRIAAGTRIVRLAGHAAERNLAFAAANDLVRGMLAVRPDLATELGEAGEPLGVIASEIDTGSARVIRSPGDLQRLHEAMRAALGLLTSDRPAVLVIDDADLLDMPSAALLGYVVRRMPGGLFIVATWTSPIGRATPLADAVAAAGEVIVVPALDLAGVAAVIGDSPHSAAEVLRRTRGVPLLVREYTTSEAPVGDGAPSRARDVVAARFESASATTRQLVGAAAVIGTVADPELLRIACGRDESETVDAIEEAIERGLLVERIDRPGYDVPHDLVRDVALSWLSLARARLLHGRVADLLARRHGVDPLATPAGAVARHLAEAGRDVDAGAWYVRAAAEAARVYAHAEALEHLRAALALGHRTLDVHHAIGNALVRLGRYSDALGSLDRACALAEDDPARQAMIEHAIAGVYDRLGDPALAQAHLEAARDLATDDGAAGLARILADLALVQHRRGDSDGAAATAAAAADIARDGGDKAALAQADNVLGVIATARGDDAEAHARLRDAARLARDAGDLDLLIAALNNLSRAHQASGADDEALAAAREALEHAERQGDRHRLAALHSHLADLLHAAGRDDEAVAELKSSASAFADLQDARTRPEVWALTEW